MMQNLVPDVASSSSAVEPEHRPHARIPPRQNLGRRSSVDQSVVKGIAATDHDPYGIVPPDDDTQNHSPRSSGSSSSSSSGFRSAKEGRGMANGNHFDRGDDHVGDQLVADSDADDGHGNDDNDDDREPSRDSSVATTNNTDNESQYIDIDDVLNFLSPSPRKMPVMLKRKGNHTTVVNVVVPSPSSAAATTPSDSQTKPRASPAGPPNNLPPQEDRDHDTGDDDVVLRHATELSTMVVNVDGDAASRFSDDLSGPTLLLVDNDEEEEGSVAATISSHARDVDVGDDASEHGPIQSPALTLHKQLSSKNNGDGGADPVETAPPSPDGPDASDGNCWDVGGGRLVVMPPHHGEEEPTPVASNRAVTVIHPGAIAADLDRLSAPHMAADGVGDGSHDGSSDDGDMEPRRDSGNLGAHGLRPAMQDPWNVHRRDVTESKADPHLSFDTNLSDSQSAHRLLDDTHASSTLELALALLEGEDAEDTSSLGSTPGARRSDASIAREALEGDTAQDMDADGEAADALDRSAYEEALSLLASDSGEVESLFRDRSTDNDVTELSTNLRSDHEANEAVRLECESSSGPLLMPNESESDTIDNSALKNSLPQHETSPEDSHNPMQWRMSLNRLKDASVATLGTATRAIGPGVVSGARGIAESFLDAEQTPNRRPSTALPDSISSLNPFVGPDGAIDPSMDRLASAATSACEAAIRASTVAVSDAMDVVQYLADANESQATPVSSHPSPSTEAPPDSVRLASRTTVGSPPSEEHKTALDQRSQLGFTRDGNIDESLSRLVSVVSSTASTLVDATGPFLHDARDFASTFATLDSTTDPHDAGMSLPRQEKKNTHLTELDVTPARQAEGSEASDRSLRRFRDATRSAAATAIQVGRPALEDARHLVVNVASSSDRPTAPAHANAESPNRGPHAVPTNCDNGTEELSSAMSRLATVTASTVVESTRCLPSLVDEAGATVGVLLNDVRVLGDAATGRISAEALSVTPSADQYTMVSRYSSFQGPGPPSAESVPEPIGTKAASAVFRRKDEAQVPRTENESSTRDARKTTPRSQPSRPPLFPRKSPSGKASDDRFLQMVVSKLTSHSLAASDSEKVLPSTEPSTLLRSTPRHSVFEEYSDAILSPPGSPPVPSTRTEPNDDDSLSLDGSGSVIELPPSNGTHEDAATGINGLSRAQSPFQSSQGAIDWGMGSFSSAKSELGGSTRHSASSRRRGPGRRFSLSSRGSGRSSHNRITLKSKQPSFRLEARAIPHSLSEDALFMDSSFHDDRSETVSTGVRSSSPELFTQDATSLASTQKHLSTPDLQLLGRHAQSATRERRMSLTPSSPSRLRRNRTILSPVSPREFPAIRQDVEGLRTMFLPLQGDALLEEALMKFTSLASLDFAFVDECDGNNTEADLVWGQLLGCWKHRAVSESLGIPQEVAWEHDTMSEPNSSSASLPRRNDGEEPTLRLCGSSSIDLLSKTCNFSKHLSYLASLQNDTPTAEGLGLRSVLRHEGQGAEATLSDLVDQSATHLQKFSCFIERLATSALLVDGGITSADSPRGWYSCGLKELGAVDRKAQRKYAGDVLQVKDILRARIIFPDEGSLAAGLVLLKRLSDESGDEALSFTIVRVKNSLAESEPLSSLPTGYRHILVSIRMSVGLIAEIQFNLAPVFEVLGEDGYRLHQELCSRDAQESSRATAVVAAVLEHCSSLGRLTNLNSTKYPIAESAPTIAARHSESTERTTDAHGNGKISPLVPEPSDSQGNSAGARGEARSSSRVQELVEDADFALKLLKHGCRATAVNPRDIPSLVCVQGLLLHLLEGDRFKHLSLSQSFQFDKAGLIDDASRCTLRCLAINSQATTLGMTGWLEYGSDSPFNRSTQLPYTLLYDLAVCQAWGDRWINVVEVFQSTVAWCEDHESACHPRTMVALLDLSASLWRYGVSDAAASALAVFHRRATSHLAAMESRCFEELNAQVIDSWKVIPTFRLENASASIVALELFRRSLHELLNRRFVRVLGRDHSVISHHRSVLGDAYSVLANCTSAAEGLYDNEDASPRAANYWRMALDQYASAFDVRDGSGSMSHAASGYTNAHRMARCLYELGNGREALDLLAAVLADEPGPSHIPAPVESNDGEEPSVRGPTFLRNVRTLPPQPTASAAADLLIARASCYWLMAVLSAELGDAPSSSGNDSNNSRLEGWSRAMSCLRSASQCYRSAIEWLRTCNHDDGREVLAECRSRLETVEEEARLLLSLRDGPTAAAPASPARPPPRAAGSMGLRAAAVLPPPAALAWSYSHGTPGSDW